MKERPILFSAPMVKAILEGRKTQTRRLVSFLDVAWDHEFDKDAFSLIGSFRRNDAGELCAFSKEFPDVRYGTMKPRFGNVGDELWVRESLWISECGKYFARDTHIPSEVMPDVLARDGSCTWFARRYIPTGFDDTDPRYTHPEFPHMTTGWTNRGRRKRDGSWVRAFDLSFCDMDTSIQVVPYHTSPAIARYEAQFRKHWPSIHMPRWASRISLVVKSVRVERLQDISQAAAIAEGGPPSHPSIDAVSRDFGYADFSRSWYAQLWESINGEGSWDANPFVWVIEFEVKP